MSEGIFFLGKIRNWSLGEPPRIEVVSQVQHNAVAQSVSNLMGKVLCVTVHQGARDQEVCSITATLPPIQSCVTKFGDATKVKLDIDPADKRALQMLLALDEEVLRFVFTPGGEQRGRIGKQPKEKSAPSPFGAFWKELDARGFHNQPDVRRWVGYAGSNEDEAKDAVRGFFGVERRSYQLSPELLLGTMEEIGGLNGAIDMVKKARDKVKAE